jgi:methylmalonyl-CoA mutase, C-terminal domain
MDRKIRVMLVNIGREDGDRDAKAVARMLRDAGCEVIFMGHDLGREAVVNVAIQEDVDAIGLWGRDGADREQDFLRVLDLLDANAAGEIALFGGGDFHEGEAERLMKAGVRKVFMTDVSSDDILSFIKILHSPT